MSREGVIQRYGELRQIRSIEEKAWRDIAFFLRPDDVSFEPGQQTQTRDDAEVFDSSPLYANDDFAGGVFSQMSNPANRWFELSPPDQDLARYQPVRQWCWAASNAIYASLAPTRSAFYAQAPATFADMGAFGFGTISQQELVESGKIADKSIPVGQIFLDVDSQGETDTVFNVFKWRGRQVRQFFRERAPSTLREDSEYLMIHGTYPNEGYRQDKLGAEYKRVRGCYVSPDIPELFVEGGFDQLPYHVIGWSRRAGRAYPRGPGHNARADMQTLNEIERTDLVATQFAAEPMILLRDEESVSAADVVPNNLLYGTMTEQGKPLAQYLERQSQFNPILQKANQKRASIQAAFKFSIMQLLSRPQMTLGEFQGWQQEELRKMAPNLIQVQMGLSGFLARRYAIITRMNLIPPAPPELGQSGLQIEFVSPLDKLQRMDEGRTVLTVHEGIERMAVTDPSVRDNFDADVGARVLANSLYTVPGILRDEKAVAQIRDERAKQQQQQAGLEQAGQVADVAATAAHAMQAATAAGARTGAGPGGPRRAA